MSSWMWIGIGAMVFGFVMVTHRSNNWGRALKKAQHHGDFASLIALIERYPKKERANRWDQAISHLWRTYARENAALFVREAVLRSDDEIIQYWILQIMEVEPEVAAEVFDEAFLTEFFQPEVAARCGRCGSCGCP